jgi:hypothetical protein
MAKLYAHDSRPPPSVLERAPDVPAAFEQVLQRAMAKNPDERYLSAGDLGRAALAASEATSLSRTERSVATGSAAPLEARPVPGRPAGDATSRPTAATEVPPRSPGPRRTRLAGLLAALVAAVVAVILLAGGGSPSKMRSRSTGGTASSPAAAGLVLGQSIGPARLGEPRKQIAAALASQGYKEKPGSSPQERNYTSGDAIYVVGFYDHGKATYIQKYNDPSITVDGVSVDSTLRTALARLPTWRRVRCARVTLLINPDHHTYFELPLGPDAHNDGSSGIIVSSFAVPFEHSACG